jgi:phenylpropionate dioxygenase-like ring-hydroxylating dioxygenase large terminal subunit
MAVTTTTGDSGRITAEGFRSSGPLYQEILDRDSRPVPSVLRLQSPLPPGVTRVPAERYTSPEFHRLEVEKLWKRVWQMACREEDIPEVGDYTIYDIADLSFLIVRTTENQVKAFYNACLHRGRQLREFDGKRASEFRCPFHGWAWEIDGRLKDVTCPWDFPDVRPDTFRLPEAKVGRWGGFIFINPNPAAEPLEDFLGDLPRHFERWSLEKRYKEVHVAKILRCNWKVAQEAFMEAYHVVATHPQILQNLGDSNSQYDVFGNFSRAITPSGVPSPHLKQRPTEQEILDSMLDKQLDEPSPILVPAGKTAREVAAEKSREAMRAIIGEEAEEYCDAEYIDAIYYTVFPNFHPWGGFSRIVYRFRPYGNDPDMSIMECMYLSPVPKGQDRPKSAPIHWLGPDDDWVKAPELGMLARVFNQDTFNIPKVQLGLKSMKNPYVTFASYNETKIRHFHQLLGRWLELE